LRGFYQDLAELKLDAGANNPPGVMGPAGGGLLDRLPDRPPGSFLTASDFEVFVKAFEHSGFRGPVNWYRNFDRNWEESAGLEYRINQPALMICAERDPVLPPWMARGMQNLVPNLTKTIVIKNCGHWTQQEKPEEVNQALIEFLCT
jgi:pimeloyl-ACP methyl ester carboxylesterase